jgi:hypothetical protein
MQSGQILAGWYACWFISICQTTYRPLIFPIRKAPMLRSFDQLPIDIHNVGQYDIVCRRSVLLILLFYAGSNFWKLRRYSDLMD